MDTEEARPLLSADRERLTALLGDQEAIVEEESQVTTENQVETSSPRPVRIEDPGNQNVGVEDDSHPLRRSVRARRISCSTSSEPRRSVPCAAAWRRNRDSAD